MSRGCGMLICKFIRTNLLINLLVLSMVLGTGLGCALRFLWSPLQKRNIGYLKLPGDIMLNTLRMVSVPLVISGIISSLASLSIRTSGSIGLRALIYYMFTTLCAVITGIVGVVLAHPGRCTVDVLETPVNEINQLDSFLDMIRNAFPDNIVAAMLSKKQTVVTEKVVPSDGDSDSIHIYTDNVNNTFVNTSEKQYEGIPALYFTHDSVSISC
ncbi:excitatory amino acid transporter 2-like [Pecten maximus]|uniref:excitatory amino acid transporter 2-like n=1 Tax=Pecten maximus TaxID=6579 RepID=UPI0014580546|nr:excitatory amino acid transporter 2-like [Pecten maximus]